LRVIERQQSPHNFVLLAALPRSALWCWPHSTKAVFQFPVYFLQDNAPFFTWNLVIMPITTFDPKTALIVVDLQKGIASRVPKQLFAQLLERNQALLAAFRLSGLPVVLVNVAGVAPGRTEQPRMSQPPAEWEQLLPELDQRASDILVTKQTWGAFVRTGLEQRLQALGVTQVVVTGVATSIGVESTARQAYELGFNVTLATDAMADLSAEAHARSIGLIFPRLGETGTAQQVIDKLGA
jgi:nicotinamidase-related amidase